MLIEYSKKMLLVVGLVSATITANASDNFYASLDDLNQVTKEVNNTIVPVKPISCESKKPLKISHVKYTYLINEKLDKEKLELNSIQLRNLVLQGIIPKEELHYFIDDYTYIKNEKRYFCIPQKDLK